MYDLFPLIPSRLEKDTRFSYFWTRYCKLICVNTCHLSYTLDKFYMIIWYRHDYISSWNGFNLLMTVLHDRWHYFQYIQQGVSISGWQHVIIIQRIPGLGKIFLISKQKVSGKDTPTPCIGLLPPSQQSDMVISMLWILKRRSSPSFTCFSTLDLLPTSLATWLTLLFIMLFEHLPWWTDHFPALIFSIFFKIIHSSINQITCECMQRDAINQILRYASKNRLPEGLKEQMLAHLTLKFKTTELQQEQVLEDLPKAIRSSISQQLFRTTLQNTYLFKGVPEDFIVQLVIFSSLVQLIYLICY